MDTPVTYRMNLTEKQYDNLPNHLTICLGDTEETMVRLSKETAYDLFTNLSQYFAVFGLDPMEKREENATQIFCPYRQVEVEMTADSCRVCSTHDCLNQAS